MDYSRLEGAYASELPSYQVARVTRGYTGGAVTQPRDWYPKVTWSAPPLDPVARDSSSIYTHRTIYTLLLVHLVWFTPVVLLVHRWFMVRCICSGTITLPSLVHQTRTYFFFRPFAAKVGMKHSNCFFDCSSHVGPDIRCMNCLKEPA